MSLMVISDTHGMTTNIMNILSGSNEITHVVHLGDKVRDADDIQSVFPQIKVIKVAGNNDFFSSERVEILFEWNGIKVFACHGHKYGVRGSKGILAKRVKETGANFGLFGHTHIKFNEEVDGVRLLNPSSTGYFIINKDKSYVYRDLY